MGSMRVRTYICTHRHPQTHTYTHDAALQKDKGAGRGFMLGCVSQCDTPVTFALASKLTRKLLCFTCHS